MVVSLLEDPEDPEVEEAVPPDAVAVAVPAPEPSPPKLEVADAESENDEYAVDDASGELVHV